MLGQKPGFDGVDEVVRGPARCGRVDGPLLLLEGASNGADLVSMRIRDLSHGERLARPPGACGSKRRGAFGGSRHVFRTFYEHGFGALNAAGRSAPKSHELEITCVSRWTRFFTELGRRKMHIECLCEKDTQFAYAIR